MLPELRELLDYDPETGTFRWRVTRGKAIAGQVAGYVKHRAGDGYRYIRLGGTAHKAARLAWLYVHGQWPKHDIDHINRKRDDDRIANLRPATRSQNVMNGLSKGQVPHKGIYWNSYHGKYCARVTQNGRQKHLGYFDSLEAARAAYLAKARELFGEFTAP